MNEVSRPGTPVIGPFKWFRWQITPDIDAALSDLSTSTGFSKRSLVRSAVVALLRDSGYAHVVDLPATRHNKKEQ